MKSGFLLIGFLGMAAFMVALSSAAKAAPFCVRVTGLPDQCLYADPAACQREAARQGGRCEANPAEIEAPVSAFNYCLAQAGGVMSCVYPAFADCAGDARRLGGACVAAKPLATPNPVKQPGVDPYGVQRP